MVIRATESAFRDAFVQYGRGKEFSYAGLGALFDYLEEVEAENAELKEELVKAKEELKVQKVKMSNASNFYRASIVGAFLCVLSINIFRGYL